MRTAFLILSLAASQASLAQAASSDEAASQSPTAEAVVHAPSDVVQELFGKVEKLEQDAAVSKDRLQIEGYGQLRFDAQQMKAVGFNAPSGVTPLVHSQFDTYAGAYLKRLEVKFSGRLLGNLRWVAGFGFDEAKLKDVGLEWSNTGLLGKSALWTVQLGQFRQKFGIEPQIGSPKIPFIERAMMYGGSNPFPAAHNLKIIGERVLGLHSTFKQGFGPFAYDLGLSVSNDGTDQKPGTGTLGLGFPSQPLNGQATLSGRVGLSLDSGVPVQLGGSFQNDDRSLRTYPAFPGGTTLTTGSIDVTYGLDARIEPLKGRWWLEGEWLSRQTPSSAVTRSESWAAVSGFKVSDIKEVEGGKVELLGRYERDMPSVHAQGFPAYLSAVSIGLKVSYGRNSHTAFNVSYFSPEDHFGEAGDLSRVLLQQQFVY